ncbi:sensor histidine kinase [Fusobacterium sp.]|uniref:sensor histidine kinase n=1 Tax=Fusobacterium sp. TaxID=68766 RepID=UPI0025BF844F|nr:sensor histidine kinase [Fusobacterium sp.]
MIKTYCKICSTLVATDIEKIERVVETVQMLSNILNVDVFIDCPTKDKDKGIVVYHARPEKNSLYSKNISGEIAISSKEPAVFRTFLTGLPSRNYKAINQEEQQVFQNIIPIFNESREVIGVIIVEYRDLEKDYFRFDAFNLTASNLLKELDLSRNSIPDFVKDGIVVFNQEGIVVYVNKIAKTIYQTLGYPNNILGESFQNIVLTKNKLEDIFLGEKIDSQEIEISNIILNISYFVPCLEEKNCNIIMLIRDITKEKNSEQELMLKSMVIKEIHHRVKNNLQTIASLLRIQKRRVDNDEVKKILTETINRILSIAITHEILSENGMDSLSIKMIIQLLYKNFFENILDKNKKIEFNIYGDDFVIDSSKATSIALVINELVQNALHYAFVNRDEGRIDVTIKKGVFFSKLIVSDNGVGMDEKKYRDNSLGLMIVERLIVDKLQGNFELKSEINQGTTIEFEIKNN